MCMVTENIPSMPATHLSPIFIFRFRILASMFLKWMCQSPCYSICTIHELTTSAPSTFKSNSLIFHSSPAHLCPLLARTADKHANGIQIGPQISFSNSSERLLKKEQSASRKSRTAFGRQQTSLCCNFKPCHLFWSLSFSPFWMPFSLRRHPLCRWRPRHSRLRRGSWWKSLTRRKWSVRAWKGLDVGQDDVLRSSLSPLEARRPLRPLKFPGTVLILETSFPHHLSLCPDSSFVLWTPSTCPLPPHLFYCAAPLVHCPHTFY